MTQSVYKLTFIVLRVDCHRIRYIWKGVGCFLLTHRWCMVRDKILDPFSSLFLFEEREYLVLPSGLVPSRNSDRTYGPRRRSTRNLWSPTGP